MQEVRSPERLVMAMKDGKVLGIIPDDWRAITTIARNWPGASVKRVKDGTVLPDECCMVVTVRLVDGEVFAVRAPKGVHVVVEDWDSGNPYDDLNNPLREVFEG